MGNQRTENPAGGMVDRVALWLAQGFGLGNIPLAPGTFGSLPGFLYWFALLYFDSAWVYFAGIAIGFGVSVWLSGIAEKILKRHDPGSVVVDEYTALPLCFAGWHVLVWIRTGDWPGAEIFNGSTAWVMGALGFGLFRLLDAFKPWPISLFQHFPGGWGVTLDDFVAAFAVNGPLVLLAFLI